ncbi:RidA family protein [Mycobacterium sp. NPDC003323]
MVHNAITPWSTGLEYGVSEAIEITAFSRILVIGGQVATDDDGNQLFVDDMEGQLNLVLDKIERLLDVAGYLPQHLVQLNWYVPQPQRYFEHMATYLERTEKWGVRPTGIFCVPKVLGRPEWMLELTGLAIA